MRYLLKKHGGRTMPELHDLYPLQAGDVTMTWTDLGSGLFGSADYLAVAEGAPLAGNPIVPVWDARLAEEMRRASE